MARRRVVSAPPYRLLATLLVLAASPAGGSSLMTTEMVEAGQNATVRCPGLSRGSGSAGYMIDQLSWSCPSRRPCSAASASGDLAQYSDRTVSIHGDRGRVSLDIRTWSLLISPVRAGDTGTYSCSVNRQTAERRLVRLVVLDAPSPPGRPMVIKHTSRHIELSWAPSLQVNNSPIKHYIIQTRLGDAGPWPAVEAGRRTTGTLTNTTIASLSPFTVYTFRVVAVNDIGRSAPSEASYPVSTLRERPGAPPELTLAVSRSPTAVEVGWRPPANNTLHGEFTGYRLTYRLYELGQPPGQLTSVSLHDVSERRYLIEGLEPYTRYEITLQVKNPEDFGPPASIIATTGEGVPSRPENVTLAAVSDRAVTVTWMPPRRANGRIRQYNAYWMSDGGPLVQRASSAGHARAFTITHLEPDRRYSVWMKAATAAGEGDRSLPVETRTDVSGPGAPVITNVTCPTDTSLGLQWRRPELVYGLVDMYYLLYRSRDSWDFVERVIPVQNDRLQYTIRLPNLTAGAVYEIRVQGATVSRLTSNKIYKGQQSLPTKVRLERGCEEIELYSRWKHRAHASLGGSEVTGIFIGCLLVFLIVILAVIWRRRRKKQPAKPTDKLATAGGYLSGWTAPTQESVPSHLFAQHVRQMRHDSGDGFRREWEMLQMAAPLEAGVATGESPQKHGMAPAAGAVGAAYQLTRVTVSSRLYRNKPVPTAYLVDGYHKSGAFIVTDRPPPAARDGLWRLVWERNVATVVLVGSSRTWASLWPEPGLAVASGDLQLEQCERLQLATCCVGALLISKLKKRARGRGRQRRITCFQYTHWPDISLPDDPLPLLEFVQRTLRNDVSPRTPVLFISGTSYCSAGIYLGLVTLLCQLKYRNELGVASYWQHIIGQCPYLLTSVDEYSLLHDCLLERVLAGETTIARDNAHRYIEQLQGAGRSSWPCPTAQAQYQQAISMETDRYTVESATMPHNQVKNRSLSYIPMDSSRMCLRSGSGGCHTDDYINASWLPGYRHVQEYILTQHPLPNTTEHFWQMVWDHRVTTVACLSPEEFGVFWPLEEEEVRRPSFVVRYMSLSAECSATYKSSWIIRSFLVESTEGADDITVRVVSVPLWPEECSTDSVLEAVLGVSDIHGQQSTPLVVIDRYGGTEGASFCLLGAVLKQLKHEACFDIFTYAKLYHQRRPGIWKTMREFLYLYHAVDAWLAARERPGVYRSSSCTSLCQSSGSPESNGAGANDVVV